MTPGEPYVTRRAPTTTAVYGDANRASSVTENSGLRYPQTVLPMPHEKTDRGIHPTQKPVVLFEYLIETYTRPGEIVLDMTAGSATTAIAAENSGRRWHCIENDPDMYVRASQRIIDHLKG